MLIRSPFALEQRCPRRWSLLAGGVLLSLAIVAAGVGLSQAARADSKDEPKKNDVTKDEPKKEEPKKEPQKEQEDLLPGFPDIDDLLKKLPGGLDDETAKLLRQQMEMTRKMLQQMRKQGGAGGAIPQLPGIGGGLVPLPNIGGGLIPNLQLRPRASRIPGNIGMTEPRLGVRLDKPSATIVDQLDLPRDQGMIIEEIRDDSAAAKAGLKQHDILLELAGKPVPSDAQGMGKLLQGINPDEAVEAIVMRKSKKETIKNLKLPKMPDQPNKGNGNPFRLNFEQPFEGLNGAFNGVGNGASTAITRTNNDFTVRHQDNGVTIGIRGTINDGKAEVSDIGIQEGEKTEKYTSVEKVPEAYRDKVNELVQQAATSGKVVKFKLKR